ncbi:MAG TPA: Tex family protein [Bacillota bacterium]|nr:Tex family protein [Bacillota bacterium]
MVKQGIIERISTELSLRPANVSSTVALLSEGNTVPFIARYRKEVTGSLDEVIIRSIEERLAYLLNLEERKEAVIRSIDEQGKLTEELRDAILAASTLQEVEDLYLPYRPKRQTRATKARERGLEPLAVLMLEHQDMNGNVQEIAARYVDPDKDVSTVDEALAGARDIVAEIVMEDAKVRAMARRHFRERGLIETTGTQDEESSEYEDYYDYQEPITDMPPHRILAINRGESKGLLKVKVSRPDEPLLSAIRGDFVSEENGIFKEQLDLAICDGYSRLLCPAMERETRNVLTEKAEDHAITVFRRNLRNLLMQSPVSGKVVLGIDPGFRTGSKIAVVDPTGKLLDTAVIYPHPPQELREEAEGIVRRLVAKHSVNVIAIGNGTASRETEAFISDFIKNSANDLSYVIVDEAGASVYSASDTAREEFPDLDVSMRGAVSIARRLQDPLAELVKIDPKSIGVGLYQHDINQTRLGEALEKTVESCVNYVGVNLNTASAALLSYVAGISKTVAKNIVSFREENGPFESRADLLEVPRLGPKTFQQAAGFLRIRSVKDPLAITPIHPESYDVAKALLSQVGSSPEDLLSPEKVTQLRRKLVDIDIKALSEELKAGVPTLEDIVDALRRPGRDPRTELPGPRFRSDILSMKDLTPGIVVNGTVRNVVDFGAFVDIGVERDGLIHISEMSDSFVESPHDVVAVGDMVRVKVIKVDSERGRISLSMRTGTPDSREEKETKM